jgi:uncharacterized protein
MKSYLLFANLAFFSLLANAQVQIRPLASAGYEKRILDFVDNMTVVDTHEHLVSPLTLKQRTSFDFMLLLQGYSASDIRSAGMPGQSFAMLLKDSLTIKEKWQILAPYWEASKNTAYNRVAVLAANQLFGVNDIDESTVVSLSEKINKAYQTDWFNQVIKERCKFDYLILDVDGKETDSSFGNERFRYLARFDNFIFINSKKVINSLAKQQNISIETLDDLVKALENAFASRKNGIVGIKTALAYNRILYYENVEKERAQRVFDLLMNAPEGSDLSFTDVKPLQDYMMHRVLDIAKSNNMPVQIHTGFTQSGINIGNTNSTHLVNLFMEYPDVDFVLLHGSYPFAGDLTPIAKSFRNVYIDMAWLYVISPSYSERYLHEWLETVPASKIMAFGGDYFNIENVYGHLMFAKQVVSRVLIDKVKDGYLSEYEANNIARMILHDNAVKLYKLSWSGRKFPEQLYPSESPH